MAAKTALVTNVTGFAGPPAVAALLGEGLRVLVTDPSFRDPAAWQAFATVHPGAERLDASGPAETVARAWALAGRIDALVSNDHVPAVHGPIESLAPDDLRATLDALVVAPFMLVQAAAPRLRAQGGGNVVFITSNRTRLPQPGGAIPDAARAGANALVRSLAIELAPDGIAVNARRTSSTARPTIPAPCSWTARRAEPSWSAAFPPGGSDGPRRSARSSASSPRRARGS